MKSSSVNSLQYRKDRISLLAKEWQGSLVNDLFMEWKIPEDMFLNLEESVCRYIAKAFNFSYIENEYLFMERLDKARKNRTNVTPNGGVVPKKEYQLEYNIFLREWCKIMRLMIHPNMSLLKKFRVTPNIRIKFGEELEENIGRGLDTSLPHSDAWVEGPWGMNCHVPIIGDTNKNYLQFYKLIDESSFRDSFLSNASSYVDMQWVLDSYEVDKDVVPKKGHVSLSDYALLHNTFRSPLCKTRISIDTTIMVGEHDSHPDRDKEYLNYIPAIGENLFIQCMRSEKDDPMEKRTTYSHYTTGNLNRVYLSNY